MPGIALDFDRLIMLASGAHDIEEVLQSPVSRYRFNLRA
jgi:elongation factor P--beta-lysine ligase